MKIFPGLFKFVRGPEATDYIEAGYLAFSEADEELSVKSIHHPLVRYAVGQLIMDTARRELDEMCVDHGQRIYTGTRDGKMSCVFGMDVPADYVGAQSRGPIHSQRPAPTPDFMQPENDPSTPYFVWRSPDGGLYEFRYEITMTAEEGEEHFQFRALTSEAEWQRWSDLPEDQGEVPEIVQRHFFG
jgi:hypothetical protein